MGKRKGVVPLNATLTEVLHWAYERYALSRPTGTQPHPVPAIAVREKPEKESDRQDRPFDLFEE
jgi:hypothetical protein